MDDFYVMQKKVDKSVLFQGMAIPGAFQDIFYKKIGFRLYRGQSAFIPVTVNGVSYEVKVTNQGFDENKYSHSRVDILQLRYDTNKQLLAVLRSVFSSTWKKLTEFYAENNGYRGFKVPEGEEEYISLYATGGTLLMECMPNIEYSESVSEIQRMDELQFETANDNEAYIESKIGIKKIRHLSRGICNSLMEKYSYKCQICGEFIGEKYGTLLIHAHHISYFTQSLNNNPDNIMIVCPNHHGIIHSCNPVFNRNTLRFEYQNGYTEGLKLNEHIKRR